MLAFSATGTCCTSQFGHKQLPSCRNCPLQDVYCSHRPVKILNRATTRERPHQRELISLHPHCLDARKRAGISATMASTTHSHCWGLPVICTRCYKHMRQRPTNLPLLCTCCQYHMGLHPTKPLLIRYQNASHCTRCLMQHLHLPLGGVWQHRVLPRISAILLIRPPFKMLLILNSFQYPNICTKKGLIFDSAKSCDNSNLPIVLPYMW